MSFEFLFNFILNGIIAGSLYALMALGLSLIYGVLKFANLAHGQYAVVGGYLFYTFFVLLHWPLIPSFIAAMVILCLMVLIIERTTFRKVYEKESYMPLVVSIALAILIRNVLLMIFQAKSRFISATNASAKFFSDAISITYVQLFIMLITAILMISLWIFLQKTKLGRTIRAVADNREMAEILGVDINRIVVITFLISALLAGTAGVLAAFDQNLHPNQGAFFTIKSFAAVILGGVGSIPGAVIGAYVIGIAENLIIGLPLGDWSIPSNYRDVVAYVILLFILYLYPTGILGGAQEIKKT